MRYFAPNSKLSKTAIMLGLIVSLFFSLSISAFAATESTSVPNGLIPTATQYTWGPNSFTPYTGSFLATGDYVSAYGMKWSETQVSTLQLAQSGLTASWLTTEYEFRPSGYQTFQIWEVGSETFYSNMPSAYPEFQPDDGEDIAVCSGWAAGFEEETSYYGRMYLSAADGAPSTVKYIFESEYGMTVPTQDDSLPSCYEQYNLCETYFGRYYSW